MRWFQPREYQCRCGREECPAPKELSPRMQEQLDRLRSDLGYPLTINSGIRCDVQTSRVGGVQGSEHGTGEGVDILAETSQARYALLVKALLLFPRIGVGRTFVHVGTSDTHPQQVAWLY